MDFKKLLPENYLKSVEVVNVQDALTAYNSIYKADLEDFKKQFFVSTCTWALPFWENYVGIKQDISIPDDLRKKLVIAKLSGQGTCTRQLLIDICQSYSGQKVEIVDHINEYYITIKFISTEINKINIIKSIIEEIKPAWLGVEYIASEKLLVSDVHTMNVSTLGTHTLGQFAFYMLVNEIDTNSIKANEKLFIDDFKMK